MANRPTIKYLVVPGFVTSKSDGDRHYIDSRKLIFLYGVDPRECLLESQIVPGVKTAHLIELYPRYDGNYTLPKGTS